MKRVLFSTFMAFLVVAASAQGLLYVHGTFNTGSTYTTVINCKDAKQASIEKQKLEQIVARGEFFTSDETAYLCMELKAQFKKENPGKEPKDFIPAIDEVVSTEESVPNILSNRGWNNVDIYYGDAAQFRLNLDPTRVLKSITVVWERTLEKGCKAWGSLYVDGNFYSKNDVSSTETTKTLSVDRRARELYIQFNIASVLLPCKVRVKKYKLEYENQTYPPLPPVYPPNPPVNPGWYDVNNYYNDGELFWISVDPTRRIRSISIRWGAHGYSRGILYVDSYHYGAKDITGNDLDTWSIGRKASRLKIIFHAQPHDYVHVRQYQIVYEENYPYHPY